MEIIRCVCLSVLLLTLATTVSSQCKNKRKCGDCIRAGCKWCSNPEKGTTYRCYAQNEIHLDCPEEHVYPKKTSDTYQVVQNDSFSIRVLFKPQSVKLNLHVGEEHEIYLVYKHARNYPVDLYYLMDLSHSMKDDKSSLSKLGNQLAVEMKTITTDFRLGFGSFVDKIKMPYVNTVKSRLDSPCDGCVAPYGFKNHLRLDKNTDLFAMRVDEAQISGNLDTPEGGFDALMQAIVCQYDIGWRKNARHLLVFSTDAEFHFAGDGRLAGLVEPNDMQCYVTDDGKYFKSTEFDYPSISQINKVAQEHNINVIFAVTKKMENVYKRLAERIKGASCGVLDKDSSNVVDLIRDEYQKIVDSINLINTADPEYIQISLASNCDGTWKETYTCGGLHQGDEVLFKATIKVLKCPPNGKAEIQFKPTALEDHIDVELDVSCECACEKQNGPGYESLSLKCSKNGDLQCGICDCGNEWYGDFCQCEKNSATSYQNDTTSTCRANKDAPICSDVGVCKCGVCTCNERDNPSERYSGNFCECDNFTCLRRGGTLCSGPDHGTCECGECVCKAGWSGEACECALNVQTCFQPGTNLECSGKGKCSCGSCKCFVVDGVQYTGKYCQDCPTCQSQQCEIYSDLVECTVFQSGSLKNNCPKVNFTIKEVDTSEDSEENDEKNRFCREVGEDGCYFYFRYVADTDTLEVQRTKECPKQVNVLALVLGLVGGIVLIGLLFLVIWKIVTTIHDGREYAKFEEESKKVQFNRGINPIHVPPTTTYVNPTFPDN